MKIKNPRFIIQEIVILIGFVLFYYSLSMIGIMLMILGGLIGLLFIFSDNRHFNKISSAIKLVVSIILSIIAIYLIHESGWNNLEGIMGSLVFMVPCILCVMIRFFIEDEGTKDGFE